MLDIDRRDTLRLGLGLGLAALWPQVARAAPIHERFFSFLIDLPGWTGLPPTAHASEARDLPEFMIVRQYVRNATDPCVAAILIGPQTKDVVEMLRSDLQHNDRETRVATASIDGFRPRSTFLLSHGMGSIMVPLGDTALFSIAFARVEEAEALALARRFDWKAMQAALPASAA